MTSGNSIIRLVRTAAITGGGPTQDFTVSGMVGTPKAAQVIVTHASSLTGTVSDEKTISIGLTDGTTSVGVCGSAQHNQATTVCKRAAFDNAVVRLPNPAGSSFEAVAVFSAWITGGIRLSWSTLPPTAYIVEVTLWFGDGASVKVGTATPGLAGTSTLVNVGFRPNHLITLGAGRAFDETLTNDYRLSYGHATDDGGTSKTIRGLFMGHTTGLATTSTTIYSTTVMFDAVWSGETTPFLFQDDTEFATTPWNASGFNITTGGVAGGTGPTIGYLAVNYGGPAYNLSEQGSAIATGVAAISGIGFRPWSAMSLQTQLAAWSDAGNTTARAGTVAFSTFTAQEEGTNSTSDLDNAADSDTSSRAMNKAISYAQNNGTTIDYEAAFSSFDSSGYSLNWTTVQAGTRAYAIFLLERDTNSATGTPSFVRLAGAAVAQEQFVAAGTPSFVRLAGAAVAQEQFVATGAPSFVRLAGAAVAQEQFVATGSPSFVRLAGAAVAEEHFIATGTPSLPRLASAAVAEEQFIATGTPSLPRLASAAVAEEQFVATGTPSFVRLAGAGLAEEHFVAASAALLPLLQATGEAEVETVASGDASFPLLQAAALAEEHFVAQSAATLAGAQGAAEAELQFVADSAASLPLPQAAAAAEEQFVAASAAYLPLLRGAGVGTVTGGDFAEDIACTIDLAASYATRAALIASYGVLFEADASHDDLVEFEASFEAVVALTAGYKTITTMTGSPC